MHTSTILSTAEICQRGEALYRQLRDQLAPAHKGKVLVIDVESGDYEIDADHLAASDRARAKHPGAALYAVRIGWDYLARVGGWRKADA